MDESDSDSESDPTDSVFFTYVVPFVGVMLVAVGIAAAVPGAYAMIQTDIATCGSPTIHVESAAATEERLADGDPGLSRLAYESLAPAERAAFDEALTDPVGEAHVEGAFPHEAAFRNGTVVIDGDDRHYATVVADNPCFVAAPLQFPLGLFAIAFGFITILSPPLYRRLVAIELSAGEE
jgi:hypothetical protein